MKFGRLCRMWSRGRFGWITVELRLLNSQPWTNSYKRSLEGEITIFVICASNLWSSTVLEPGQSSLISSNVLISSWPSFAPILCRHQQLERDVFNTNTRQDNMRVGLRMLFAYTSKNIGAVGGTRRYPTDLGSRLLKSKARGISLRWPAKLVC